MKLKEVNIAISLSRIHGCSAVLQRKIARCETLDEVIQHTAGATGLAATAVYRYAIAARDCTQ